MTTAPQTWHPLARPEPSNRSDRYVRRANLRLPAGVSEHRATFLLQEALRLMSLPGEDQGRTYYFRHVALLGLPAAAPPGRWIAHAQSTMQALATHAVHGTDCRAAASNAVFFHSQQEALEWLLGRLFRASPHAVRASQWFVSMIAPFAGNAAATTQLVAVIERLRTLPAGWFAAATVLLDAVEAEPSACYMLEAIPESVIRAWLSELGGGTSTAVPHPPITLRRRRTLLRRLTVQIEPTPHRTANRGTAAVGSRIESPAQHAAGHGPPACLVWMAALAVIAEHPSELARRRTVMAARALLQELADSLASTSAEDNRDQNPPASPVIMEVAPASRSSKQLVAASEATVDRGRQDDPEARDGMAFNAPLAIDHSLFTEAGGLYFLLNALRHLGIEAAIESLPTTLKRIFLPKLIESIAHAAAVARDDAALLCVVGAPDADASFESFRRSVVAAQSWPRTLAAHPDLEILPKRLIRVWTLAVRRWCWQNARLTLREIVSRPGRILLTRTDLDVILSIDTVDMRLRRIGLDLDPGWLPWFGRVVRFHYVYELSRHSDGGEAL